MEDALPKGVMFNAYPDSIGRNLADTVHMLRRPEFKDVFSLFYILPTIFNSDLDRGFSIIDYDLNDELISREDLERLHELNVMFKLDLVLNHLSAGSPQFQTRIVVRYQLEPMRLRNTAPAFDGELEIHDSEEHRLHLTWTHDACTATLDPDLRDHSFSITHKGDACEEYVTTYR